MLSGVAILVYAAAAACALLILGVLELVAPTQPRRRRALPPRRGRRAEAASGSLVVRARAEQSVRQPAVVATTVQARVAVAAEPRPTMEARRGTEVAAVPSAPASPVDSCYALYEAEDYREVVTEGVAALDTMSRGASAVEPREVARLWGVVGLAQQALGDYDGAWAAFQEAVRAAPADDRGVWERHLAALALDVGRKLVAQVEDPGTADAEECLTMLYAAITWLDRGVAAAPADDALHAAATAAHAALGPAYGRVAAQLIQHQEYQAARRLLEHRLTDATCPPGLQQTFRELLSATHSGEVGQLTAEAIRRIQDGREAEALATLGRAEKLLATIPEDGLTERRRHELEQRLWWGYTKVGMERVESGLYEEALEPLLHALGFASVGPLRLQETRRPLVQALEGLVEARNVLVARLVTAGDRRGARAASDKLRALLRTALEGGLTPDEMAGVLARAEELRGLAESSESKSR